MGRVDPRALSRQAERYELALRSQAHSSARVECADHGYDRGPVGVIVWLGQVRYSSEHQDAQHREGSDSQARLGDIPPGPGRRPRNLGGRRECCHTCRLWPTDPTWKIIIPTANSTPEPRAHEGYEWLYVITGRMWLIIADHDVVLGPGESPSLAPVSRTGSAAPATS